MGDVQDRVVLVLGPNGKLEKSFDWYEHRDQQVRLAKLFAQGIEEKRHVTAEAGTGTGKSAAYLTAAVESGKRVLVSTANISLQDQILDKDAPTLQQVLREFKAVKVTGLGNYVCKLKVEKFKRSSANSMFGATFDVRQEDAAAVGRVWTEFDAWMRTTADGDTQKFPLTLPMAIKKEVVTSTDECVRDSCKFFNDCYGLGAKKKAKDAQVVVVNHWLLLLDLRMRSASSGAQSVIPGPVDIVVIDEAHRLAKIARDVLGTEITENRGRYLTDRIQKMLLNIENGDEYVSYARECMAALFTYMRRLMRLMEEQKLEQMVLGDETEEVQRPFSMLMELAKRMLDGTPRGMDDADDRAMWQKVGEMVAELASDLRTIATPDLNFVRYVELVGPEGKQRVNLEAKPIDVAPLLRPMLFEAKLADTPEDEEEEIDLEEALRKAPPVTVLATSATFAVDGSMSYWREEVGCRQSLDLVVPAPFDYRRNSLLYVPADAARFDSKAYRNDGMMEVYFDALADRTLQLLVMSRMRALCLYTSNRAIKEVTDRLWSRLEQHHATVLVQGMMPRRELVRMFKGEERPVLFATESFREGLDIQGEKLSLVVMDKFPFATPSDVIFNAQKRVINERYRDQWAWFDRLQIPMTIIDMKQGFGRLIRTQTDTGVVAILEGRWRKQYGERILRSLPPAPVTSDLSKVQQFFKDR